MLVMDYKEDYQPTDGRTVIKKIINELLANKSFYSLSTPPPSTNKQIFTDD